MVGKCQHYSAHPYSRLWCIGDAGCGGGELEQGGGVNFRWLKLGIWAGLDVGVALNSCGGGWATTLFYWYAIHIVLPTEPVRIDCLVLG